MAAPSTAFDAVEFRDPERAARGIAVLEADLCPETFASLATLLRQSPDPDASLLGLEKLCEAGAADALDSGRALSAAVALFAHSRFLGDTLVRSPELLGWALDPEHFYHVLSADEMRAHLGWIGASRPGEKADDPTAALTLARFKRMHMLRIALRDVLHAAELAEAALELSNLADTLLQGAQDYLWRDLVGRFGRPLVPAESGPLEGRFVVLALGKLGGSELNYSSDIDLMYLHTGDGETAGTIRIPNHEFYKQLATRLTALLSEMTTEGFAYRVDLRLRPEGSAGELCASLDSAVSYYHSRARDWELQMLIKARPAAGHLQLGERFLEMVRPLIYRTSTDFSMIEKVAESRDRIQRSLKQRVHQRRDVKLERGAIRDIEFLVQCLQRLYGGRDPFLLSGGTLFSLHRLHAKGYLAMTEYGRLSAAYQYLRTLEHRLQMLDDRQTHELPGKPAEIEILDRKMREAAPPGETSEPLLETVDRYLREVREVYEQVVASQGEGEQIPSVDSPPYQEESPEPVLDHSWHSRVRHIERRHPALARAIRKLSVRRGQKAFSHLLDKVVYDADLLDLLESQPGLAACLADLIEHSEYLAEQLVRYPEDVRRIADIADCPEPDENDLDQLLFDDEADLESLAAASYNEAAMLLRRFYRRRRLVMLAESVHCRRPVFSTLERSSALAECVIRAAHRIAIEETKRSEGPPPEGGSLQVIALGRLGMREFDLGSDADLAFVAVADGPAERLWWLRCGERMIEVITSYTSEGKMFSVDPRLRPRGRDGELVQTEGAFNEYFERHAEAWEALSYMKARTVAGDLERGREFLAGLQQIAWRRFGTDADLAQVLREMRKRLERETGRDHPLKGGVGGYYDIDFVLLYLRLKNAGVFFEYLSTPQRIEIVRESGGLSDEQADFLLRAATFFRALDHASRIVSGHSSGRAPATGKRQESISDLLARWSPIQPHSQPLLSLIDDVRRETRQLYRDVLR